MTRVPVDHEARLTIRTDHGRTLFVEAGAGTGKTTALVERVVSLLASERIAPRDLAAITFTEAAAAELRDRVRDALERAAGGADPAVDTEAGQAACSAALRAIDDAAISTLHGFAQRLLAEFPLEAGLPPSFDVLADVEAELDRAERWNAFVSELLDDTSLQQHLLVAFVLDLNLKKLRQIARTFEDHYDRLESIAFDASPVPRIDPKPILEKLDAALALRDHCNDEEDLLGLRLDLLARARPHYDALGSTDLDDVLDAIEHTAPLPLPGKKAGVAKNWGGVIEEVRTLLEQAGHEYEAAIDHLSGTVLERLLVELRRHVLEMAADRRARGTCSFHDLLVLARGLLRDHPEVRAAAAARWKVVMVDEFQDTDPIQAELAALLTGVDGPDGGGWETIAIDDGRLFVVGDPKQSIYRFRRADLSVYTRARTAYRGVDVALVENFRSSPSIVAWVDAVFAEVLGSGSEFQAPHVPLHAFRDEPTSDHAVFLLGDASKDRVAVVRATEADEIARAITQLVATGRQITDPRSGELRHLRYDDIAILLPTRTSLAAIESALDRAAIPSRVESQSLVFATTEVGELITVLTAVDDPTDAIATVGALRTNGFGCSDADLIEWVQQGGNWDYRRSYPSAIAADHPVADGFRVLRALHAERRWQSVSETVADVIDALHAMPLATATVRPRDQWRRHRFLLDRARAFADAGGGDLRAFLEWVAARLDEGAAAVETVVAELDDNAVRFLTVHGAKGLEFPVAVLAGLGSNLQKQRPAVVWTDDGRAEVRTTGTPRDITTPHYAEAATREQQHDVAERERLLYVAATRARDILIVSLHHKASVACHAARIREHAGLGGGLPFPFIDALETEQLTLNVDTTVFDDAAYVEQRAAFVAKRERALATGGRLRVLTATALSHSETPDGAVVESGPPWRRGRAGTAIGRAVHAVLQVADPATPDSIDALALGEATAEGLPHLASEVASLVRSALASPAVVAAHATGRARREVPVTASVDGVLLEGIIDLLVADPDGLTVIDYKTDALRSTADIDARAARYAPQLAAYAVALETALGIPVRRAVLVFAREDGAEEREVTDLTAAKDEIRRAIAATAPPT